MNKRHALLLLACAYSYQVSAGTLTFSANPPTPDANSIYNWNGAAFDADNVGGSGTNANGSPNNGGANDAATYVASNQPAQGQTFLTGNATFGYELNSITVRVVGYTNNVATGNDNTFWNLGDTGSSFRIRVGKVNGTAFYPKVAEYATAGGSGNPGASNSANGPGTWLTFTFATPVRLDPNTLYGVDLGGGSGYFELLGIRDAAVGGNPYTAGTAYTAGANGYGEFAVVPQAGERVFHLGLAAASGPVTPPAAGPIAHPGMLHTEADFERMRLKVAEGAQPWRGSWDLLAASRNSWTNWGPRAVGTINRGTSPDNSALIYNDAAAAYQNALRWKITGDVAHANKAIEILNAWGYTLTGISGDADRYLAAGLYGYQMANAAEIMRTYSGWSATDFNQFKTMMVNVFYPLNNWFLVNHNDAHIQNYWANWDLCNMASILSIGILCDDQAKIDQAVNYFKTGGGNGAINNAVPILHSPTLGQWQESGRDQEHTIMGVGLMATICEMGWNQGIDLYGYNGKRFMAGAEYVARYNNWNEVPFAYYSWRSGQGNGVANTNWYVSNAARGATRPIWDLIVGHYSHRLGIYLPELETKAAALRPDGGPSYGAHGSAFDQLGFTSLTSYRGPVAMTIPTGVYQISARHSGSALTVANNGTTNGTNIEQRAITDPNIADSQNWTVTSLGSGQHSILGAYSGRAAEVWGISGADGANIDLWEYWGGNNQKYAFTPTDSGYFRMAPVHSGKSVAVSGGSTADGANVLQWQYFGSGDQQWKFTAASTVRRLRLSTTTNQYIHHYWYGARVGLDPYPAQSSEFRVIPGLAGSLGVSFESIDYPGHYLHVRSSGEVGIDTSDGTAAFNNDASFRRVAGLSNTAMCSYQLWTDTTRYMRNVSGSIQATTVPSGEEANATFAEVFPAPGY
jgi:hypothetical protein